MLRPLLSQIEIGVNDYHRLTMWAILSYVNNINWRNLKSKLKSIFPRKYSSRISSVSFNHYSNNLGDLLCGLRLKNLTNRLFWCIRITYLHDPMRISAKSRRTKFSARRGTLEEHFAFAVFPNRCAQIGASLWAREHRRFRLRCVQRLSLSF